jgi:hypothetical protein
VIQKNSARTQKMPGPLKIKRKHSFTDVLEHANTNDFIETVRTLQFPVVHQVDLAPVLQAGLNNPFIRHVCLILA